MRKLCYKLIILLAIAMVSNEGHTQSNKLKLNFDEEGKTWVKASLRGQFWARYMEMNPGTTVNGEAVDNAFDFSLRRVRLGISSQVTEKLFVYALLGGNNINVKTQKSFSFDVLDYYAEYTFVKQLSVGIGENTWDGFSRWTVRSSKSLMALDAPLFTLHTVNKNDDLGRSLGAWAKGEFGQLDYVLSLKSPSVYGVEAQEGVVDYALNRPRMRTGGYLKWDFLENESNKTAYSGGTGTHLGKARLFSLGAGFMYQPKMTSSLVNGVEEYYDFKAFCAEAYYDVPVRTKGAAVTAYLGFFDYDFGPNYIRNVGANDYTDGGTSFNGSGNDFPMMGTGQTLFGQLGYLFKKDLLPKGQLQPNIAVQYSMFDGLDEPMVTYDFGINCYFKGHANKLTLGYQYRPVYDYNSASELMVTDRAGQLILQYQIQIN
tara:strand:+ start:3622 stop:4911 length:1290 start_codon:yes stop_codon:yes gene_type:complete